MTATERLEGVARAVIVIVVGLLAGAAAVGVFVFYPGSLTELVGILIAIAVVGSGLRVGAGIAGSLLPAYDVAEVRVDGPILRSAGGGFPGGAVGTDADDIVEQIEQADADRGADGLLVRLNTPGGQVVPSDDIRRAVADFDGPTIAYAEDTCASGGYWIASGCDRIVAHESSLVGSIGVIASKLNAKGLADRLGVSYERIAAGEYKDAGTPFKEFTDDDREYLQGLADDYYEQFVERVTEGRDLDEETVRDTEAQVYLGMEAHERGLVDELGTADDVEAALATELGVESVSVREFTPERGLRERLAGGARATAYALGAGIASVFEDEPGERIRL
jgi:protease-4